MTTSAASDLLRRVRMLELVARDNVSGALQGDYVSAVKGSGLLFEEPRRYVPGDPVRSIDWNITARLMEPHVRVHREERQREVMLLVDVSPSMHVGFQERTKLETAVELAATLAVSAHEAGDRLGYVLYADRILDESPPRSDRGQLWTVLRGLLEGTRPWDRPVTVSDPRLAVHHLEGRRGHPKVVFLLSDFIDDDVADDLSYLRPHHDVSLLHVFDPLEVTGLSEASVPSFDPESGDRAGSRAWLPAGDVSSSPLSELERTAAVRGIDYLSVSTGDDLASSLAALFNRKRSRRAR